MTRQHQIWKETDRNSAQNANSKKPWPKGYQTYTESNAFADTNKKSINHKPLFREKSSPNMDRNNRTHISKHFVPSTLTKPSYKSSALRDRTSMESKTKSPRSWLNRSLNTLLLDNRPACEFFRPQQQATSHQIVQSFEMKPKKYWACTYRSTTLREMGLYIKYRPTEKTNVDDLTNKWLTQYRLKDKHSPRRTTKSNVREVKLKKTIRFTPTTKVWQ